MIFVEVLGRRGDVVQRVRLERLPATIGRGYACDVIVADPLVDAQHARLAADEHGAVVLEDLGSVNGLYAGGARERTPRVAVQGITAARIGRTHLRIVPADAAVPPAIPDTEAGDRLGALLASPRGSRAVLVAGFAFAALSFWLGSFENKAASAAGGEALGLALLSAGWAGLWAMIGRANVQRFSFWPHLAATWLFFMAIGGVALVGGYAEFLFPTGPFAAAVLLAVLVLSATLFARHLALATLLSRRRRNAIAAGTTAVILGLVLLAGRLASDELDSGGTVGLSATLKPVPARWIPAAGIEPFLRTTDDLKRELDGLTGGE
jgi:Inner membrane component of T3SS, cytoplasmic domain